MDCPEKERLTLRPCHVKADGSHAVGDPQNLRSVPPPRRGGRHSHSPCQTPPTLGRDTRQDALNTRDEIRELIGLSW